MRRVPLLSGSRIVFVPVGDDDAVIAPPPPPAQTVETDAAVRDALRFPLAGPPLAQLAVRGGRATVVVEPHALPLPGVEADCRREALAATMDALEQAGTRPERVTVLVAGGLGRRLGRRDLERLLSPPRARAFRGAIVVHDAESPDLRPLDVGGRTVLVHPALLDTDVVVTVTAAETIVHGGPGALVAACDAATVRRLAGADSLVRFSGSEEWRRSASLESALAERVGLVGISLVLDHPRLTGTFRAYAHDPASFERVLRSPLRRVYSRLPAAARRAVLARLGRRLGTAAAYAGRPSVAHAEALLRGIELRGARLDAPVDALVVGMPWVGLHAPREPLNPITSSAIALGHALRLWRDAFPIRRGGTLVIATTLVRSFAHGSADPYHSAFAALATGTDGDALVEAEQNAAADERLLAAYREGRTCHPLLPFADWAGCLPALRRIGQVVVAGSRDAAAARALGFVPTHSVASGLEMAHGVAGGRARLGVLVAPPYPPVLVGQTEQP